MKRISLTIKHVTCFMFLVTLMTACKPVAIPPVANANTPVPAATSTNYTDTTTWKTYRNEEYGFEIKYPAGVEVKNFSGRDSITKKTYNYLGFISGGYFGQKGVGVYFRKYENTNNLSAIAWAEQRYGSLKSFAQEKGLPQPIIVSVAEKTIGSSAGVLYELFGGDGTDVNFYVKTKKGILEIFYYLLAAVNDPKLEIRQKNITTFLSTMQIL